MVGSDEKISSESPAEDVSSVLHVASSGDWSARNVFTTGAGVLLRIDGALGASLKSSEDCVTATGELLNGEQA